MRMGSVPFKQNALQAAMCLGLLMAGVALAAPAKPTTPTISKKHSTMPAPTSNSTAQRATPSPYATPDDRALTATMAAREADWRNGAVVYQVLVDRFAPSANLEAKKALYPAPKKLRAWNETPLRGEYLEKEKLWSHEIDFWGGDLQSTAAKLDYVKELGADVLYLNPIHLAYTNHKYDALDYKQISPEYGTVDDLKALTKASRDRGMKVVLDGVFNHMGRNSSYFKEAQSSPNNKYRNWFVFGQEYPGGARVWYDAQNLPELNLENQAVRDYIFAKPDSVVQTYLANGIDGWRLDVAFDIGPRFLAELTQAAHTRKPGSLVVGEIANYPREWFPSVDAVMNFTLREIMLGTVRGGIKPHTAGQMIDRMVSEAGIEPMLKSWVLLDNHDNDRLFTSLPVPEQRKLAQVLQFTLPGAPNLYYGSELGMMGGEDPEMRAPMRWDLVNPQNPHLAWTKQLIKLRKDHRALRIGNFRLVTAGSLLAFERYTDRAADTVVVLTNPSSDVVTETVMIANSKIMNGSAMTDLLNPNTRPLRVMSGVTQVTLAPYGMAVFKLQTKQVEGGYSAYKRVQ